MQSKKFKFLCEEVNNGIGIRAPVGVDAAYEGMKIQLLDHHAPIYKNLHIYQQHGSVCGVIPAQERVKFDEQQTSARWMAEGRRICYEAERSRRTGQTVTLIESGLKSKNKKFRGRFEK